jgi:hypothetical protein
VFRHLADHHGVDLFAASERLHRIKQAQGLGPADDVYLGLTGDVYDPKSGEFIGNLITYR